MSASDAAPLPRLGEVFFDVRGDSRSMRLSWYADTDVAVFSIWQGGKCTGTFRLPMDDLSRMIEILQRGPKRRNERWADRRAGDRGAGDRGAGDRGPRDRGPGDRGPGERSAGGRTGGHDAGEARGYADSPYDAEYGAGYNGEQEADADYTMVQGAGPASGADYNAAAYGHGSDGNGGHYGTGPYGGGQYGSGQYGTGDYSSRDNGSGDYGPGEYYPDAGYRDGGSRTAGHPNERYQPADYGRPDFDEAPRAPRPAYWHEDDRHQADMTGQRPAPPEADGYGEQRFVPPYVRPQPDASELGFFDDSEYRQPADPAGRPRHSAGRHSSGQAQ